MQFFAAIAFGFILMAVAYIANGMTDASAAFKTGFSVSGTLLALNLIGDGLRAIRKNYKW